MSFQGSDALQRWHYLLLLNVLSERPSKVLCSPYKMVSSVSENGLKQLGKTVILYTALSHGGIVMELFSVNDHYLQPFLWMYMTSFPNLPPTRSACHCRPSQKHLSQHVPKCSAPVPGGGRSPQHDLRVAERWRKRLSHRVSAVITLCSWASICFTLWCFM